MRAMHSLTHSLVALPALLLLLLSAARSDATISSYADATVVLSGLIPDPQYTGSITGTDPVAITRGGFLTLPNYPGSTSATARGSAGASHGALEASTYVSIGPGDFKAVGYSQGIAKFLDDVTIHPSDLGLVGMPGTFILPIEIAGGILGSAPSGGLGAPGYLYARWFYDVRVNRARRWSAGDDVLISEFIDDPEDAVLTTGLFESTEIAFVFGEPFELDASLTVLGDGTVGGGRSGFESLVLQANWQGITEVRDAGGNLVAFTMESASATDYTDEIVVPEPASAVSALASLLVLATLRLRAARGQAVRRGACRPRPAPGR